MEKQHSKTHQRARGPEIPLFPLERSPGRMLYRASLALRSGLLRHLRDSGFKLSVEEWVVMASLWEQDELTQLQLGERVRKDRHFVSRLLDSLEDQGFLERRGTEGDRRVKRVCLTPAGRNAKSTISRVLSGYLSRTFEGLTQAQFDCFMHCLELILDRHAGQKSEGFEDLIEAGSVSSSHRRRRKSTAGIGT